MGRPTHTDRRRAQLARRFAALEAMEPRTMVTESLGIFLAGIGVAAGGLPERPPAEVEGPAPRRRAGADQSQPQARGEDQTPQRPAAGSRRSAAEPGTENARRRNHADWLALGRSVPAHPDAGAASLAVPRPARDAGGGGGGGGGEASGPAAGGAITPLRLPPPVPLDVAGQSLQVNAAPPAVLPRTDAGAVGAGQGSPAPGGSQTIATADGGFTAAVSTDPGGGALFAGSSAMLTASAGGAVASGGGLIPDDLDLDLAGTGGMDLGFSSFPLYTLDYKYGIVLFDGGAQIAKTGTAVDLRAQVRDVTVQSYSWDTSGLSSEATGITGTSTYRLQFTWTSSAIPQPTTRSVTLTVTDTNNQTEVQTYYFYLPVQGGAGSGTARRPPGPARWRPTPWCPTGRPSRAITSTSRPTPEPWRPSWSCPATAPTSRP